MKSFDRRTFLSLAGAFSAGALITACRGGKVTPVEVEPPPQLVRFPEKTELILLTDRPPQLETPLKYFRSDLTPNEAYFVRWHLANIPTSVDTKTYRLKITGHVNKPLELSLDDLRRKFTPVTQVVFNQCSGNSRSLFQPRIPGGQWKHGAMGNAKFTGVRLKDLLDAAGVKAGAVDVAFSALDRAPLPSVPNFVKSLEIDHARDGEVMVAYEMNGEPLPMLNGFPLRLIVPGWFGTYWVKALDEISVLPEKFKGYWMEKAYRIPATADLNEAPDKLAEQTVPINRMPVRSIMVRPEPHEKLSANQAYEIEGVAFDGGAGIKRVEVSTDGGATWNEATLGNELGKYSWRRWRLNWTPNKTGDYKLLVRATNAAGETQRASFWNRSGYLRNVIEETHVTVA
ncbi:MAG TPA: molybdopterin-dependent oxidoreductase [Blastocatellia bacterium]|nr:molybdopterin-dependent oxidoreductase [Blastocatellia bacterium]